MKITILYDNETLDPELEADWGFAALVEACGRTILFDTGASGRLLLKNMEKLNISPQAIGEVFISHDHWDHTGGLPEILRRKPVRVYVPDTFSKVLPESETIALSHATEIHEHIYSTGTLKNIEQSMCIRENGSVVVIAGCSHPGVHDIVEAASEIGPVTALIGGLHGFNDFPVLQSLELVCATHCTQHQQEIRTRFPHTSIAGGAGRIIEI